MPNTLPCALHGDKSSLSPWAIAEIRKLTGPAPAAFVFQMGAAWAVIALAIALAVHAQNMLVTAIALLIIASRQNVLGLLVHEQTHGGLGGRHGDWIANLFCAYPLLLLTLEGYAQVHLAHHRDYFKESDPDFARKSGKDWTFPKSGRELLKLFLLDVLQVNTLRLIKSKRMASDLPSIARRSPIPKWIRPAFLLTSAAVLTATGTWFYFLLFWMLPLLTLMQVFVRWGAICEHEYNVMNASVAASTPLIVSTWFEKLLLPNLNFGMHAYHHFFPGVSFRNLPRVHDIFRQEGLVNQANVFHGYWPYLRFILGKRPQQ